MNPKDITNQKLSFSLGKHSNKEKKLIILKE